MTAHKVGARALKNRLGAWIDLVRRGDRVIVTERGVPVAEIRSITRSEDPVERILEDMATEGLLTLPTHPLRRKFEPIPIQGGLISATITEDREDRF